MVEKQCTHEGCEYVAKAETEEAAMQDLQNHAAEVHGDNSNDHDVAAEDKMAM